MAKVAGLRLAWMAAALAVGACGGGGGDDSPANITLSGVVTFDFVPAVAGAGLDYDATEARPVRGATVEVVSATGAAVLASAKTGASGAYSVGVPPNRSVFVRVKAEMTRTGAPNWDFRVLDNTSNDALYALDSPVFTTGTTATTRDLHAASGWGGSSYTGTRAAAPFAILDTVRESLDYLLAADPTVSLPALRLHWSTENVPVFGDDGMPDPDTGEIGTSFASVEFGGIFILGAENVDTDEYDRHVVVHEWGHYFEYVLARTDSIGGPHTLGDVLDMRTAFSEGFSNALSALVLGQSVYRDVIGNRQSQAPAFNIEGPLPCLVGTNSGPGCNPGWFSEASVHEILYDIVDDNVDLAGHDQLSMSFSAVYAVLRNAHRNTPALTTIFSFIHALKTANPADAALIDAIVASESIATINDAHGSSESNDAGSFFGDVLPIYRPISVNGAVVNVCSTDEFGDSNKLGSRQFLRFSVGAAATHTFRAVATSIPAGEVADPDLVLHRNGFLQVSEGPPAADCNAQAPAKCFETFSAPLAAGDYVLEVYEYSNTQSDDSDVPPIGRTCFNVSVTQ